MGILVVGISHNSAPVSLLDKVARDAAGAHKLALDVAGSEHVGEATVLATCNRLEVYAAVERFHGSVEEISQLMVAPAETLPEALVPHLYVHYDDGAVSHLFNVAAGLDSMALGESQILGQAREALRLGQELGTVGPSLNTLFQQALRVGKRAHAETDVDRAAPSLVSAALERAGRRLGTLRGARVVVVGAGSMAALAVATASRAGAGPVVVANRTLAKAERLASQHGATAIPLDRVEATLGEADLVVCCTGAAGTVLDAGMLHHARAGRTDPLAVIDLALPHDVSPDVAYEPGVELIDLATLAGDLGRVGEQVEVAAVREIIAEELTAFLAARRSASVTPTVVALRSMATGVVEAELERLESRLPDLDPVARAEIEAAVRRVADKLLHQPTVRVKELAGETGAVSYAAALAELFALDPDAVDAVTRPGGER